MTKYKITFSTERGVKYYSSTVEAENEKDAFLKIREKVESKGKRLPDEVWTHTEIID